MKRWIFMLGLILLITGSSEAIQTSNWLRESVVCIDSATGVEVVPESSHVVVSFGNCLNSHIYAARSTSPGADPAWIDSSSYAGSVPPNYFFFDQAGDIDADSGAGIYTVNVILWRGHTRTTNEFKFELTDSSFNSALTRVGQINEDTKNLTFTGTDVKATLDGETVTLADDGITAAKIANNAIGASEIADDAIDYATFAATPPTAWWPEGTLLTTSDNIGINWGDISNQGTSVNLSATGVSIVTSGVTVSTNNDKTNYTLASNAITATVLHGEAAKEIADSTLRFVVDSGEDWDTDTLKAGALLYDIYVNQNWDVWDDGTRTLTTADWSTHSAADAAHSVYDTLYVHKDDFMRWTAAEVGSLLNTVEDANKVNFMRWTAAEVGSLLNTIEDAHKANYKADVSNLDEPISGLDDNPWNNALTDTTSGMGSWFADYFNAIFGPKFDSLVQSIADANKANFKADVSGLSTHSAGDVWTAGSRSLSTPADYKADVTNLDVEVSSRFTQAGGDSVKDYTRAARDTINAHAPHGDDWASVGAGGVDLSDEVDSLLAAIYDRSNDTSFVRILSQYVLKHLYPDSVTIDNSNAWDLSGGGDVSVEIDSILAAIYDRANDTSFVRIISQYVLLRLHPDSLRAFLATHDSTLLEQTAACGSGTGTRTVTITVKNAADSVAISGFEIDVYDSSSGERQANGTTNSNGVYTCSLDDETYTVHITNPPWSLTSPRRFVITGNMDSTFYATRFTPGSPPADSLCVVWGRVKDKHGDPYVGAKVSIWMDAYPVTFGGILIDVATKSVVYTDTLGVFEFSGGIYYSSSLNPSNLKWKVRVKTKNAEWIWEGMVAVPSQASWEIEIPDL